VGVNVGYARCSTTSQDLTAQREQLAALGVPADCVYLDKGADRHQPGRPGLDQALAAVRDGDTFTDTKLDRLARSIPDAAAAIIGLTLPALSAALRGVVAAGHRRAVG
jgi:DNA invertase Pin-like site-specific DNA recombinase